MTAMVAERRYLRLLSPPGSSFFLFGPRGTGKSTWAREHFPDARWFDLLDERRFLELTADPGLFADELRTAVPGSDVVIDEVQRVPPLLNEVHRAIEAQGLRFVLLGSSARKLTAAGTNLLAGRALRKELFPLTQDELGEDADTEAILRRGSIPLVLSADDPDATLDAYVHTYVQQEVRGEALVRNLPGFLRFLPVAAVLHGQQVNVTGIAREAGVARTTVGGYLDILEDTLLVTRLTGYEARARLRERKLPKLYWVDPGLVRAVKRRLGPPIPEERGALFEGWVLTQLRAHAQRGGLYDSIHYWAPAGSKLEVDFLLQRDDRLLAIEAKAATRFTPSLARGLRAAADISGVTRRILVYAGRRELRTSDGIDVWPLPRLAEALVTDQLWP